MLRAQSSASHMRECSRPRIRWLRHGHVGSAPAERQQHARCTPPWVRTVCEWACALYRSRCDGGARLHTRAVRSAYKSDARAWRAVRRLGAHAILVFPNARASVVDSWTCRNKLARNACSQCRHTGGAHVASPRLAGRVPDALSPRRHRTRPRAPRTRTREPEKALACAVRSGREPRLAAPCVLRAAQRPACSLPYDRDAHLLARARRLTTPLRRACSRQCSQSGPHAGHLSRDSSAAAVVNTTWSASHARRNRKCAGVRRLYLEARPALLCLACTSACMRTYRRTCLCTHLRPTFTPSPNLA